MHFEHPYFKTNYVFQYTPAQIGDTWQQFIHVYSDIPLPLHIADDANHTVGIHILSRPLKGGSGFDHIWMARDGYQRIAPGFLEYAVTTGQAPRIQLFQTAHMLEIFRPLRRDMPSLPIDGKHVLQAVFVPGQDSLVIPAHRRFLDAHYSEYLVATRKAHAHNTATGYLPRRNSNTPRLGHG